MSNPVDYPEMNDLDEQLTAYLDGELSSDESKDLEQRLIDDETLRMRLAELRKSYELLDELQGVWVLVDGSQRRVEVIHSLLTLHRP